MCAAKNGYKPLFLKVTFSLRTVLGRNTIGFHLAIFFFFFSLSEFTLSFMNRKPYLSCELENEETLEASAVCVFCCC